MSDAACDSASVTEKRLSPGLAAVQAAEELDGSGARFGHDRWERSTDNPNGGYGITSGAQAGCAWSMVLACSARTTAAA